MKVDQEFDKVRVRIHLYELVDRGLEYESFLDLLRDKASEELGRDLDFWQIVDYTIVGHEVAAIIMSIKGYEEEA